MIRSSACQRQADTFPALSGRHGERRSYTTSWDTIDTAISVRRNGKRVWRGKYASDPQLLAAVIRERAPKAKRVVFETGPLSVWFYHELTARGVPAICIDARHAKAALNMATNKTDANDADGLAHLAEVGFYKAVRVKDSDSMLTRTLVGARGQLIKIVTDLSNQIRGLMKTFGLVIPKSGGRVFEAHVRSLLASNKKLEQVILPLLEAWRSIRTRAAELDRQLVAAARTSTPCRLLMSIPGGPRRRGTLFVGTVLPGIGCWEDDVLVDKNVQPVTDADCSLA